MITIFAFSIAALLLAVALWSTAMAVLGRPPGPRLLLAAGIVELELIVQAIIAVVRLFLGHEDPPLGPFLGYLLVSVVLLPIVIRPGAEGARSRWDSAIIAAVCIAVAVAVLRLVAIW